MRRNLADLWLRNWVLKLMALILAILLWLVVQGDRPPPADPQDGPAARQEEPNQTPASDVDVP